MLFYIFWSYAQILAIGQHDEEKVYDLANKSIRKQNDNGKEKDGSVKRQIDNGKEDNAKEKDDKEKYDHNGKDDQKDNNHVTLAYVASYLTLVEATLESAPQLTIQLYLSIINTSTDTTSTRKYIHIFYDGMLLRS